MERGIGESLPVAISETMYFDYQLQVCQQRGL
jgi:hypothetical protein